jgi:hypothetical protein
MRTAIFCAIVLCACGPGGRHGGGGGGGDDGASCPRCSADKSAVIDCNGNSTECAAGMACSNGTCENACQAADMNHESVGCDYYAVDMDGANGPPNNGCFAVFVANTSRDPVHMTVDWNGQSIDLAQFAKLPQGTGNALTYGAYDPNAGLASGEVAILFLAYQFSPLNLPTVPCPVAAAIGAGAQINGTGIGHAFHITTDQPVVAYQMLPYGGGKAAATGASLLLPASAWGTNYIAVSANDDMAPPIPIPMGPSHDFVSMQDGTQVTIRPTSSIAGGGGMPTGAANAPYTMTVNKGDYMQLTQAAPLSGSVVSSSAPIGVFGGHQIMSIDRCCGDHGEQMIAPVQALGWEYVAAPHADRHASAVDPRVFRIYGAVDGTQLTYEPPNTGPATIDQGKVIEIRTQGPWVVRSQDMNHPFAFFTYMTGGGVTDNTDPSYDPNYDGSGDPDFVRLPPPTQFLSHYVFFTDPTYPFTSLTIVRQKNMSGQFDDVSLDCLNGTPVSGWQPVGTTGQYELAFFKMVDHWNAQAGTCNNGVHVMNSPTPFGVWVWGWGSDDTMSGWVSYGFPAGEGVLPINTVIIQ